MRLGIFGSVLTISLLGCEAQVIGPPASRTSGASSTSSGRSASGTLGTSTSTSGGSTPTTSSASSTDGSTAGAGSTSTSSAATSSTSTSGTSSSSTTSGGVTSGSAGSTGATCTGCGANARCESGQCVCLPGFTAGASGCEPVATTDPTTHSEADVCQAWKSGHVENASTPFIAGPTQCDPGTLPVDALDDALRRLNMFRWIVGLGPVTDDASDDANDQACADISANNPAGPDAHYPQSSATCYSTAGAAGAGSSNIAWGCYSAAGAMDQWMEDWGNESTLGHRRWMLNPPLGPVGIGFYSGGSGQWPSASCLGVFGMSGGGPEPAWYAWPPPGYVPSDGVYTVWSLHSGSMGVSGATISITRVSDGASIPITVTPLQGSYGEDATSWTANGAPGFQAGETYRVAVTHLSSGAPDFTYDVSIVTCP